MRLVCIQGDLRSANAPAFKASAIECTKQCFDGWRGGPVLSSFAPDPAPGAYSFTADANLAAQMDAVVANRFKFVLLLTYGPPNNSAWRLVASGSAVTPLTQRDGSPLPSDPRSVRPQSELYASILLAWEAEIAYCARRMVEAGMDPGQYLFVEPWNEPYGAKSYSADAGEFNRFMNAMMPGLRSICSRLGCKLGITAMDGLFGMGSWRTQADVQKTWWGNETSGLLRRNYGAGDVRNPDWYALADVIFTHAGYYDFRQEPTLSVKQSAERAGYQFSIALDIFRSQKWCGWQDKPVIVSEFLGAALYCGLYAAGRGLESANRRPEARRGEMAVAIGEELLRRGAAGHTVYRLSNGSGDEAVSTEQSGLINSDGQWTYATRALLRARGKSFSSPPAGSWPSGWASDGVSELLPVPH